MLQLYIYDRYVRALSHLLQKLYKSVDREERQMKAFYEEQLNDLNSELKRYQQSGGDSQAADPVTPQQVLDMKWVRGRKERESQIKWLKIPVN